MPPIDRSRMPFAREGLAARALFGARIAWTAGTPGFTENEYWATLALTMRPVRQSAAVSFGIAGPMPNVMTPMSCVYAVVALNTPPPLNRLRTRRLHRHVPSAQLRFVARESHRSTCGASQATRTACTTPRAVIDPSKGLLAQSGRRPGSERTGTNGTPCVRAAARTVAGAVPSLTSHVPDCKFNCLRNRYGEEPVRAAGAWHRCLRPSTSQLTHGHYGSVMDPNDRRTNSALLHRRGGVGAAFSSQEWRKRYSGVSIPNATASSSIDCRWFA